MEIRLREIARSFATREKAREVLESRMPLGSTVTIDAEGIMGSPSFFAELLCRLTEGDTKVTVVTPDEYLVTTLNRLVEQLELQQKVAIHQSALA